MKRAYIDLGHGGTDSGAIGHGGIYEKDIVLDVGLMVKELLVKNNVEVKLSRETDKSLDLNSRVCDANKFNAHCFVSIHCNSAENKSARGYETFCYSSNELVKCVHNSIIEDKNLYDNDRGIKQASYYVIKNTIMPACLCELSFISNKLDKDIVVSNKKQFANKIAKGICKYLGVAFSEGTTSTEITKEYSIGEYKHNVCVTVDTLNVRSGRGVEYEVIGKLNKNNKVDVWYIDKARDGSLWGSFRYINREKNINQVGFIALNYTSPV